MDDLARPDTDQSVQIPVLSDEALLDAMLFQVLSDGHTYPQPKALSVRMGRPEELERIRRILHGAEFHTKLLRAKRDLAAYTADMIKTWLPQLAKQMLALALESEDSRTQVVAIKDLLDRGGTGAAQKLSLSTPSVYRDAIADLLEPVALPEPAPTEESRPEGFVP